MGKINNEEVEPVEEKPPVLKNWKQLYLVVFLFLVFQLLLMEMSPNNSMRKAINGSNDQLKGMGCPFMKNYCFSKPN